MCLSSARNEDKSGGWIREKKTTVKIFRVLGKGELFFIFNRRLIFTLARADIHTHTHKEEWAR